MGADKAAYGRLTFIEIDSRPEGKPPNWRCKCACGNEVVAARNNIKSGNTTSCGCAKSEMMRARNKAMAKHGESLTNLYFLHKGMVARCYTPGNGSYENYGARGIRVCQRWRGENGFLNFKADMGPRPSTAHSIERRKLNGHYAPSNCYWATPEQQAQNKRNVIRVLCCGEEMSLKKACRSMGLNYGTIKGRIQKLGLSFEEALKYQKYARTKS